MILLLILEELQYVSYVYCYVQYSGICANLP